MASGYSKQYLKHQYLRKGIVERRLYQTRIAAKCVRQNTLVVLPTALGKTMIAILSAIKRLEKYPWTKILVLAPTRPLVMQHYDSFKKILKFPEEDFALFSGRVPARRREKFWKNARFIFSTPQIVKNDLENGRYDLSNVSLLVLDEVHKSRRTYAYIPISTEYHARCSDPIVLGLTASPGKNYDQIMELIDIIGFEHVEARVDEDEDVAPYIYDIEMIFEKIELPVEYQDILHQIDDLFWSSVKKLLNLKLIPLKHKYSKMDFIELAPRIWDEIYDPQNAALKKKYFSALRHCSACISLLHACETLVIEDSMVFMQFLEKIQYKAETKGGGAKVIAENPKFQDLLVNLADHPLPPHPKFQSLQNFLGEIFSEDPETKVIIFAQFRDTATRIVEEIEKTIGNQYDARPVRFVGQASRPGDPGLNQSQQRQIIEEFSEDNWNILVATSVAEEGLDIPNVDHVIFWEAVPSEIRLIQRRGRTGRHDAGNCYILFTENSLDHIYLAISHRREDVMRQAIKDLQQNLILFTINRQPMLPPVEKELNTTTGEQMREKTANQNSSSNFSSRMPAFLDREARLSREIKKYCQEVEKNNQKVSQIKEKYPYLSKTGKWLVMTIETCGKSEITEEEIFRLAKLEEVDLSKLAWEISRVKKLVPEVSIIKSKKSITSMIGSEKPATIKKRPSTRFLTKIGQWIVSTVEDEISETELFEMADLEEIEMDSLKYELRRAVKSRFIVKTSQKNGDIVYSAATEA